MKQTILVITAIILGILTLNPVWGWEEQLEACHIRGIQPSMCPDDESYVGIPYTPGIPEKNNITGNPGILRG